MSWPMSLKWLRTEAEISTVLRVAPMRSARMTALFFVRSVVPKQGMVTAMISVMGRSSIFIARPVMSTARVESRPPERPTTAVLAPVCSSRCFRPREASSKISRQRSSRSSLSSGTKGMGATYRVSLVGETVREKVAPQGASASSITWVRRRSYASRWISISEINRPPSNRRSARRLPFSAII